MFAGKTRALIDAVLAAGDGAVAAKPRVDTRFGARAIVSHDGSRLPALAIGSEPELQAAARGASLVALDEAQFLTEELAQAVTRLAENQAVLAAALDLDFAGRPFPATQVLHEAARTIRPLRSTCTRCGSEATMTQRLVNGSPAAFSDSVVLLGGPGLYEPRCAACWAAERVLSEPSRSFPQANGCKSISFSGVGRRTGGSSS
jgi:thymidine kinase